MNQTLNAGTGSAPTDPRSSDSNHQAAPVPLQSGVALALARWRSNLIDLSRRNPLLSLRPTSSSYLALTQPTVDTIFQRLVKADKPWSFWLPPEEAPTDKTAVPAVLAPRGKGVDGKKTPPRPAENELVAGELPRRRLLQTLTNLYRRARTDYQERGLHILHIAFGVLEWRDDHSKESYRSPLILVPVELVRKSFREPFILKPMPDDPLLNPALEVRLRQDFGFQLPPLPEDWEQKSLLEYFEEIISAIHGLSGWRVESAAVLSLFSFFKGVIYRDLEENSEALLNHPLVRALGGEALAAELHVEVPAEEELDAVQVPQATHYVLDADGSQRQSLEAAARGQSFVLQGPPGTGKSQTITNLIADSLARGKQVLFVSEKMAALEVVYKRLRQLGLGDFCLELHSHKTNKRDIVAELARCLQYGRRNAAPGTVDFAKLQLRREQLSGYVKALHALREPFQRSAWSGYCDVAQASAAPLVPLGMPKTRGAMGPADSLLVLSELTPTWLDESQQAVRRLAELWHIVPRSQPLSPEETDFPWWGFKADKYSLQVRDDVLGLIEKADSRLERVLAFAEQYAEQSGLNGPLPWLLKAGELLESAPEHVAPHWLREGGAGGKEHLKNVGGELEKAAGHYERFVQARAPLTERYGQDIWHLPEGTADRLESAWLAVVPLLAPGDERGAALLAHQQHLRGWAADTQKRTPGLLTEARALEKWLAIPLPQGVGSDADSAAAEGRLDPSPHILRQLQRLANLCQSSNAPERTWVHNPESLHKARTLITASRPLLTDYHRQRTQLLECYTEPLFNLELDRIAEGFAGPYRSFFRIFNKEYRRDRRALKRCCRGETLPRNFVADVSVGRELIALQKRFEAEKAARQELLGRYENGTSTDIEQAERATRVAAEAVEIARELECESLPGRFIDALCAGKGASDKIRAATKRLHDLLGDWVHATDALKDCLPLTLMPGHGEPLQECALTAINHYAKDLQAKLNHLASFADLVLLHAPSPPRDLAAIVADVRQAEKLRQQEKAQEAEATRWHEVLGPGFQRVDSDWSALRKAHIWASRTFEFFGNKPPETFVRLAASERSSIPSLGDLRHALEQYEQSLHHLEVRFEAPGLTFAGKRLAEHLPDVVKQRLAVMRSRVAELSDWVDFRQLQSRFAHLGLSNFVDAVQKKEVAAEQLPAIFSKAINSEWLEMVVEQDPHLRSFRRAEHERNLHEFQELDRRWIEGASQRTIEKIDARRPDPAQIAPGSEGALLMKEATKKTRHMPLRRLFEAMPNLLMQLKPCLLMSPLSVSQFLPPQMKIDVVVFDEASQICPEDAVGAIYRGKQAVITGDDQQLPPTAFFQQIADDDETDEEVETVSFESVLDACRGSGLPQRMLRWHYRSRHEDLIAFSNQHVYDNRLITFPAAYSRHPELGVKFKHVPDGVYDRGGARENIREAEVVADMVCEHFRRFPKKSLGVIAFSLPQMNAIEQQLEQRLLNHPELETHFSDDRLDGFFVKNLETVQGDQRDVIFFSMGYGRDKDGKLTMNFGPINQDGGQRRLNVAVTRAREKLVVVSSIQPHEFDLRATQAPGVLLLHKYLTYAEQGERADTARTPLPAPRNMLEADVMQALQQRGYKVVPQVGCGADKIDLAVVDPKDPGKFILGIEWDGPDYCNSPTARDRERLRHEVLRALGWKIHRLWAPDWLHRRDEEIDRLCKELPPGSANRG